MAAIDYAGIRDQLKSVLEADSRLEGVRVYVEEEPQIGLSDVQKAIAVFTYTRTASADQNISRGTRTRYNLRMSLWTVYFSMESYQDACNGRDAVIGQLELVLMENRTLGGLVTASWLEGGELFSARAPQGSTFVAAGETIFVSEVSAISN